MLREGAEWLWYGRGPAAAAARGGLAPFSALFGAVVARRNRRFDAVTAAAPLPALSVGNLTVGGTGKTPVSSWFAQRLHARGARPALILRGYGDDEWRVHRLLTPEVPVVCHADRVAAMVQAQRDGADCAVLDDAFQHRRAGRIADIVLVSADRFTGNVRLLPAGPFREGLAALHRATAIIVTVKAADERTVAHVEATLRDAAPSVPVARVRLVPDAVQRADAAMDDVGGVSENIIPREPLSWLRNRRLLLVSAIADATAFERQVEAHGARVVRHARFPDHHDFRARDVSGMVAAGQGVDGVVCTLKDAVKLAPRWPRVGPPLWYVSQTLVVDRGAEVLERECDRVLAARTATVPPVG